ncbi:hypothetical protein BH09BAC1_BH09BAC1_22440 [soil metagenome]
MLKEILTELFARDLGKLEQEISLYPTDESLWLTAEGISNSGGNLALHLCGNLNHFIGAQLGHTGYVRQREKEFTTKGISRTQVIEDVKATAHAVVKTLEQISEEELAKVFPLEVFGKPIQTGFFLTHLTAHLNYHLGQINYHRRLVAE